VIVNLYDVLGSRKNPMKKSRKKELQQKKRVLKEDVFVTFVTGLWEKAAKAKLYLITALVVILAAVIVAGLMAEREEVVKDEGYEALARLKERIGKMESATEEDRTAMEDAWLKGLADLIPKTEDSAVQPEVIFYYADALFRKGGDDNLVKAERQCRSFVRKFPDNYFVIGVKELLGKTLFEQKKYAEALEVFQDVYDSLLAGEGAELKAAKYEACYYIGRCHELLGELEQARSMYEQLASQGDESPQWAEMARFRLSKMKS